MRRSVRRARISTVASQLSCDMLLLQEAPFQCSIISFQRILRALTPSRMSTAPRGWQACTTGRRRKSHDCIRDYNTMLPDETSDCVCESATDASRDSCGIATLQRVPQALAKYKVKNSNGQSWSKAFRPRPTLHSPQRLLFPPRKNSKRRRPGEWGLGPNLTSGPPKSERLRDSDRSSKDAIGVKYPPTIEWPKSAQVNTGHPAPCSSSLG